MRPDFLTLDDVLSIHAKQIRIFETALAPEAARESVGEVATPRDGRIDGNAHQERERGHDSRAPSSRRFYLP